MKSISPAMMAHVQSGVTTLCTCIDVIRTDGSAYYFTDSDLPVTVDGNVHLPNYGYARSSIPSRLQFEVDSMDITGVMQGSDANAGLNLTSISVTREDIDAGLYDFAVVYVYMVNWNDLSMGKIPLRRGWLGEVESNEDGTYKAEIRGLSQVFTYRLGEGFSPDCRADLGDYRCKIVLDAPLWLANTGYNVGDRILGHITSPIGYFNLNITNADFEEPLIVDPGTEVPGWITYGDTVNCRWTQQSNFYNVVAQSGNYFIATENFTGLQGTQMGLTQDVNLVTAGLSTTELDTGNCRVIASVMCCSAGLNSSYRFRVYALDGEGAILANVYDSGARSTSQTKFVQVECDNQLLPTGTRSVRFDLQSNKLGKDQHGCFFDNFQASVNTPDGNYGNASNYGGVAFMCTQLGITGATEPVWSNEIGATYSDGGVEWVCVASPKAIGTVSSVTSANSFTATALTNATGYFDDGIVVWETGDNAGRSMEVRTWEGGVMTMLFRPFHPMTVGDRFVVYPGCQKTRSICNSKFNNVINMRAEPDVPGQDRLMNTPDVSSQT